MPITPEDFILTVGAKPKLTWLFKVNGAIRKWISAATLEDAEEKIRVEFPGADFAFAGVMA